MIHLFIKERPNQTRGIPWYASAMIRLHMIGKFEESELVASRVAAAQMGLIITPTGTEYTGDGLNEDGSISIDAEPGTFPQLPAGSDLKQFTPQHPNHAYGDFLKSTLRGAAAGMGPNYNTLAGDLESTSYSSVRWASLEDQEFWKDLQEWFIEHCQITTFETWLEMALLSGQLAPLPASKYDKFNSPSWYPHRWKSVDPQKESAAKVQDISFALKSRTQLAAEEGDDWEDLIQQIALEQKRMDDLGVKLMPEKISLAEAQKGGMGSESDDGEEKK
jgi:lambda family phage portal protein